MDIVVAGVDPVIEALRNELGIKFECPVEFIWNPNMRPWSGWVTRGNFNAKVRIRLKYWLLPVVDGIEAKITVNLAAFDYSCLIRVKQDLTRTLLHEFRHAWQMQNQPLRFVTGGRRDARGSDEYLNSWFERDARDFAEKNLNRYLDLVRIDTSTE